MDANEKKHRLEELKARGAARRQAVADALSDRELEDEEVIDALEEQRGAQNVRRVIVPNPVPEFPGQLLIRQPGDDYKVWKSQLHRNHKSGERIAAQEDLARQVVIYPDAKAFGEMASKFPAILDLVFNAAIEFANGAMVERGKE